MSFLASVFVALACWGGEDTSVVARVNGAPITRCELDFSLAYYRPQFSNVKQTSNLGEGDSIGLALRSVLDKAIDVKLQELLAVEHGLMIDASYENFLIDWAKENVVRQKAKEQNQVVYGPIQFSESAFYQYRFSQVVMRLKESLAVSVFDLSEARIRAWYDSTRENDFRRRDYISLLKVTMSTSEKGLLDDLRNDLTTTSDPAYLQSKYGCEARVLTVDDQTSRFLSEEEPEFLRLACALRNGEVGTWQQDGDQRFLLKCIERKPMGYMHLDEVRGIVRSRMIDRAYEELLRTRRTHARLEVDDLALAHIRNQLVGIER